jgi:hypothetical protein
MIAAISKRRGSGLWERSQSISQKEPLFGGCYAAMKRIVI